MNSIKEQFFAPIQHEIVPEEQYERLESLPIVCEAVARMCNHSIYIVDYSKQNFFFVSSHPLFLCGYTAEEVKEMGYSFYEKVVSPEDLQMMLEINKFGWGLFNTMPHAGVFNSCFSYDFFLHHKNGSKILINHRLTPIFLTPNDNIWIALCAVSFSSQKSSGNVVFTLDNRLEYFSYDFEKQKMVQHGTPQLTQQEKAILNLSMRGFDIEDTAKELQISIHTAINHRRSIANKLKVKNIVNATAIFKSQF